MRNLTKEAAAKRYPQRAAALVELNWAYRVARRMGDRNRVDEFPITPDDADKAVEIVRKWRDDPDPKLQEKSLHVHAEFARVNAKNRENHMKALKIIGESEQHTNVNVQVVTFGVSAPKMPEVKAEVIERPALIP